MTEHTVKKFDADLRVLTNETSKMGRLAQSQIVEVWRVAKRVWWCR